ncbi:MAG: MarR family winged helix-turn-helix transcriptional regulator [Longimicrobiales bacterium]
MSLERSTRVGLGVSRLIDRMEKKGWVTRERGSKDRRRVWCMITSDGLSLLDRLDAPIDTVNDLMSAALNDEELRTLTAYLDRIRARLGALDQV